MLLQDFYKILSIENTEVQKHRVQIEINKNHVIFNGHFPNNPIIPGVCMIQIIKELTEQIMEHKLTVKIVSEVKFTALINPEEHPELRLELDIMTTDDDKIKVKNVTYFGETVALKLNATFNKINS